VLTNGGERDIAEDNHLLVVLFEADLEVFAWVHGEAGEDFGVHIRYAAGGVDQALALRVFTDCFENRLDCYHDFLSVHACSRHVQGYSRV
jgi:hypothetical protein